MLAQDGETQPVSSKVNQRDCKLTTDVRDGRPERDTKRKGTTYLEKQSRSDGQIHINVSDHKSKTVFPNNHTVQNILSTLSEKKINLKNQPTV